MNKGCIRQLVYYKIITGNLDVFINMSIELGESARDCRAEKEAYEKQWPKNIVREKSANILSCGKESP
ncbi:MAG: hypothetical protein AAB521_00645 [Patescibacteria group bacterium]